MNKKRICARIACLQIITTPLLISGGEKVAPFEYTKAVAGQKILVVLQFGQFDPKAHEVRHISREVGYLVDGQRPIGTDGAVTARTEFKQLEISWNGKRVPIARSAWSSIFNVPMRFVNPVKSNESGFSIVPSLDGSAVMLYFRPDVGDAEEPEEAWLVIDSHGKWRKFHSAELLE